VLSGAFGAQRAAVRADGNRPVNASATVAGDISAHNSPALVRNPRDGDQLAVANRIDEPDYSCALQVSSDGGVSWRQVTIPIPSGAGRKCYAPDVAYGADGTLYLVFVTLRGEGNVPGAAWLVQSSDNGDTLSAPARVLGPLAFQVRLVADPRVARRLHLTWLQAQEVGPFRFARTGNPIMSARSDDGGIGWSPPARVSGGARERVVAGAPAIGDGALYVLYLDLGEDRLDYEGGHEGRGGPPHPGPWQLVLSRSGDGGDSWQERVVDERLVPVERFVVFTPPYPSIAAAGARVYASFHDGRLGDADVWLWASEDRGATFAAPARVNDTPRRDGTHQSLPRIALAPGGRIDVAYYDRRGDPSGTRAEVSLQSSFDGGQTFSDRIAVSDRAFDTGIGFGAERGMPELGSRLGLASTDTAALAVWTDTRAGTRASHKQDIASGLVTFSVPPRLGGPAEHALRVGGIGAAAAGVLLLLRRRPRRTVAPPR